MLEKQLVDSIYSGQGPSAIPEIAELFGVARSTVYRAVQRAAMLRE